MQRQEKEKQERSQIENKQGLEKDTERNKNLLIEFCQTDEFPFFEDKKQQGPMKEKYFLKRCISIKYHKPAINFPLLKSEYGNYFLILDNKKKLLFLFNLIDYEYMIIDPTDYKNIDYTRYKCFEGVNLIFKDIVRTFLFLLEKDKEEELFKEKIICAENFFTKYTEVFYNRKQKACIRKIKGTNETLDEKQKQIKTYFSDFFLYIVYDFDTYDNFLTFSEDSETMFLEYNKNPEETILINEKLIFNMFKGLEKEQLIYYDRTSSFVFDHGKFYFYDPKYQETLSQSSRAIIDFFFHANLFAFLKTAQTKRETAKRKLETGSKINIIEFIKTCCLSLNDINQD